jgi:hypothetical protein
MRLLAWTGVFLLSLGMSTSAFGATDQEQFEKKVGKYAVPDSLSEKPKGLCVCQDGGPNNGLAGVLYRQTETISGFEEGVRVRCNVRGFDEASGALTLELYCDTFVPLAK